MVNIFGNRIIFSNKILAKLSKYTNTKYTITNATYNKTSKQRTYTIPGFSSIHVIH